MKKVGPQKIKATFSDYTQLRILRKRAYATVFFGENDHWFSFWPSEHITVGVLNCSCKNQAAQQALWYDSTGFITAHAENAIFDKSVHEH